MGPPRSIKKEPTKAGTLPWHSACPSSLPRSVSAQATVEDCPKQASFAMAKKRKMRRKDEAELPTEVKKNIGRLCRFSRNMHKGLAIAEINDDTWNDMLGAVKTIHRVALMKSQETMHAVKVLEKSTKQKNFQDEISREAMQDKIKLANTLLAQGMHWDKVEGALVRLANLCGNEDDTLRTVAKFISPELASTKEPKNEHDK